MNKRSLILLPIAMLFLTGCNNTPADSTTSSGQTANVDSPYSLDFANNYATYKEAFPYVGDGSTVNDVTLDGLAFKTAGCFVGSYNNVGYLMMKTKWDTPAPAFIASAESLGKITKVEFVTGASASGAATYKVKLSKTPILEADTADAVNVGAGTEYSVTATEADGYGYFAISTCNFSNQKNGQLASLKVTFVK